MYRGTSPLFDVPEFPTLRRVKPLPKRRRTDIDTDQPPAERSSPGFALPPSLAGLPLPGPDATAEELLAHADSLSSHMALNSYYMPILGGVQDMLRNTVSASATGNPSDPLSAGNMAASLTDLEATVNEFAAAYAGGILRDDEDDRGDYMDHLQQPGNTKKRKVPANMSAARGQGGADAGSGQSGEDEPTDRGIPTGRIEPEVVEPFQPPPLLSSLGPRKSKLTAATIAGLQHKEVLKGRKRQLASVLGALTHGDTLALDEALSGSYPSFDDPNAPPPKVHLSRRRNARLARMAKQAMKHPHPDRIPLVTPGFEFTYSHPSPTADRLVATKEEVAALRTRFEEELARQAAKAAQAASKALSATPVKSKKKSGDRAKQRARISGGSSAKGGDQAAEFLEQNALAKPKSGKKKKRSALANASNPHHLRNYVPSRLPHASSQANTNVQDMFSPLPIRFLSAEIPPRRKKKSYQSHPMVQVTNPADEWICPYCEYELFYGNEHDYRRAIRNRKKILRRRRRARERASAAASGNVAPKNGADKENEDYDDDEEDGFDASSEEFATVPKQTLDNDPGSEQLSSGFG